MNWVTILFIILWGIIALQCLTLFLVERIYKRFEYVRLERSLVEMTLKLKERLRDWTLQNEDEEDCSWESVKTIKEWLNELPEWYRELAMKYENQLFSVASEWMWDALSSWFYWSKTDEWWNFRWRVYNYYVSWSVLPPLPEKEEKEHPPKKKTAKRLEKKTSKK